MTVVCSAVCCNSYAVWGWNHTWRPQWACCLSSA